MMRKPISISISICTDHHGLGGLGVIRKAVVCDDGTMWECGGAGKDSETWKEIPPIPQPETKTVLVPRLSVGPTHPGLLVKKPEDMHVNEDFKSYLQCIAQRTNSPLPEYFTSPEPGGQGCFGAICKFDYFEETLTTSKCVARGKKAAEKLAAKQMVTELLPKVGFQSIEELAQPEKDDEN